MLIGAIGAIVGPIFLTLGGSFLVIRGSERTYQMVGLATFASGTGLVITESLAIATTPI